MSIPGNGIDPSTAIGLILRATLLLGVVGVAQRIARGRVSAATRHEAWALTLAALLLLPALGAALPRWPIGIELGAWSTPAEARSAPRAADRSALAPPDIQTIEPASMASSADASSATRGGVQVPWGLVFFAVYATVALLLLVRLCLHHIAAHRLIGRAEPIRDAEWTSLLRACADAVRVEHAPALLRSHERSMPMASGIWCPVILLPDIAETWTLDRRRAVLLHELAHVARRDCITQLLAEVACAAYWFHPAVWWTARRLRIDRELACDDRVLAAGTEARSYAEHLLELAYALGGRRGPALVVTMADRGQLEGRLLALLDAGRNRTAPGLRGQIAGLALMTALIVPLARVDAAVVGDSAHEEFATPSLASPSSTVASAGNDAEDGAAQEPAEPDDNLPGTWEVRPEEGGKIHLRMSEGRSSWGRSIPADAIDGLAAAQRASTGSPVRLTLRRDAGTFTFEGTFRSGVGAGTYTFAPNPAFAAELQKRGIGKPSAREQKELASHDVGFAMLDELAAQGYAKLSIQDLVRAARHGVDGEYVKEMGALGYRLGTIDPLIKMRDHGVGPEFVRDLAKAGLPHLAADELVRVRDHGVTPEYIGELRQLGYDIRDVNELVKTRDHGVTAEYVRGLASAGYANVPLADLVTARDHGVTPEFAKGLADLGFAKLPLADLVKVRDHGVTPDFAKELQRLGYRPAIEELVKARDHGVTPAYLKELKDLGYQELSLDDAVSLRDHGLSADRIRAANEHAGTRLPPDMLKRLQ